MLHIYNNCFSGCPSEDCNIDIPKIIEETVKRLGGEITSKIQDTYNISLPEEKRKDLKKVLEEVTKEMEADETDKRYKKPHSPKPPKNMGL